MRIQSVSIFSILGVLLLLQSCSSYKNKRVLFKTPKDIKTEEPVFIINEADTSKNVYRHRIKPGDRLLLRFLNNFDIGMNAEKSATASANLESSSGYLVNYDSTVILPLLGRVNLVGLTRLEASAKLEKEYSKFIINPIIDLNIASLGVTILGEVVRSGKIIIDKENTTLVDVIAMAGGIKDSGKKNYIKIIRGAEVIIVDLRKIEALESPALTLHANDIIYVEPYNVKAATEPTSAAAPITQLVLTALQTALLVTQLYIILK